VIAVRNTLNAIITGCWLADPEVIHDLSALLKNAARWAELAEASA
jgi:hypothetical protein